MAFFGSGVKAISYANMADGSAANASFAPDMLELAFDSTYKHMYLSNKSAKCIYKVTIEP